MSKNSRDIDWEKRNNVINSYLAGESMDKVSDLLGSDGPIGTEARAPSEARVYEILTSFNRAERRKIEYYRRCYLPNKPNKTIVINYMEAVIDLFSQIDYAMERDDKSLHKEVESLLMTRVKVDNYLKGHKLIKNWLDKKKVITFDVNQVWETGSAESKNRSYGI